MKKLLSITLAVVLVLALGSLAFAAKGSLANGANLEAEIDVHATIGPYAKIWVTKNIDFGVLNGAAGIYIVNGSSFLGLVEELFGNAGYQTNTNPGGWGTFEVETNTDIMIDVDFLYSEWMASKTVFGVHRGGSEDHGGWWNIEEYNAWAGNFDHGLGGSSFTHDYVKGSRPYDVNGAIWIESISQQEAKVYNGKLVVTISK